MDSSKNGHRKRKVGTFLRALRAAVRLRRKLRGPMRPSWDEDFETWATVLHHYATRSTVLPLSVQRFAMRGPLRARPVPGLKYEPVVAGGVPAEWFRPDGCDESRVLLYLHGGGYSIGSIDTHRDPVSRLCAAARTRGFVIDYRLAPEHPFPAQVEDAVSAYRWMLGTGVDPKRVVVAGESAGGGLVLSLMVSLRDAGVPLPAATVCVSPWVDLEMRGETMTHNARFDYVSREVLRRYVRRFITERDVKNPLAAPIHADLRGHPPLLVLAGGAEVLLDDARAIAARARTAGVDVTLEIEEDMIHAWHLFPFPRSRRTLERMGAYVTASVDRLSG